MPFQPGDYVIESRGVSCGYVCQILSQRDPSKGKYQYDMYRTAGRSWSSQILYWDFDFQNGLYRLATVQEMPHTCSPRWKSTPPPPQATVSMPYPAPAASGQTSWKVGDWYGPPLTSFNWIGRIVSGPDWMGQWEVREYDLASGVTISGGNTLWTKLQGLIPWTAPLPAWAANIIPSAPAIVTQPVANSYSAAPAPKDASRLVQFFAGDITKKPKGMPNKCWSCLREMSATMDRFYGNNTQLVAYNPRHVGTGEITTLRCETVPANLCSTCRPRGC